MKRHQERTSDERGQTLVEFAALLPVLCLLLFGIIQFGVVFHDYLTVTTHRASARGRPLSAATPATQAPLPRPPP